jgi:hypothetical protein
VLVQGEGLNGSFEIFPIAGKPYQGPSIRSAGETHRAALRSAFQWVFSMRGPTRELLAASEVIESRLGMPEGLLARVVAPTEDGMLLLNLWASEELRRASNDDPAHQAILRERGIAELTAHTTVERYEAARFTLGSTNP